MRSASPRMSTSTVQHFPVQWSSDIAGARQPGYNNAPFATYSAAVEVSSSADVSDHDREQGVEIYDVKFFGLDPGAAIRDRFVWNGRILTVRSIAMNAAGRGATFLYHAEYRPQRGQL